MENVEQLSHKRQAIKVIELLDDKISMEEIHKSIAKLDKSVWRNPIPGVVFVLVGLAAFATFVYFIVSNFESGRFKIIDPREFRESNNKIILFDYLLYAFWTIIPPSYFLWEYLRIFPYKLDPSQLADIKYTQELSSKIWAALLFIFGIILYCKYGFR